MSLVNVLKSINLQKNNPGVAARIQVSQYLHAQFNKADYAISFDVVTKRVYSATAKASLIANFQKIYAEITAAEEASSIAKLDDIRNYFDTQCSKLLKQYDIANQLFVDVLKEQDQAMDCSSDTPLPPVTPLSPFQIIYNAAKQKDSAAIKEILQEVCIDVEISIEGAPIAQLAFEGNIPAVTYLQKEFNASSRWAIYGYGRSLNKDEAQRLLEKAKSYNEWFQLLRQYAKGLAVCDPQTAKYYLTSIIEKLSEEEQRKLDAPIVCGSILGFHEAPNIRHSNPMQNNLCGLEPEAVIHAKISAWARTGRLDEVKHYMREKQLENYLNSRDAHLDFRAEPESTFNYDDCVNHFGYNLARIGLLEEALNVFYSFVHNGVYESYRIRNYQTSIIKGLGRGGYHKKALDFIKSDMFILKHLYRSHAGVLSEKEKAQVEKDYEHQRNLAVVELVVDGLAKGGALAEVSHITTSYKLEAIKPYLKSAIICSFIQKGYLFEARQAIHQPIKDKEWWVLMRVIVDNININFTTHSFQRTALEFVTEWLISDGSVALADVHYPVKFDAIKPKAMPLIKLMLQRELTFMQSVVWYDAVALQILLQLSKSQKSISLDLQLMIFDFLYHPFTRIEKQEVLTKYSFQFRTRHLLTDLSTHAEFRPLISVWEKAPAAERNGLTLFRMVKEKKLMTQATVSLNLEEEKNVHQQVRHG